MTRIATQHRAGVRLHDRCKGQFPLDFAAGSLKPKGLICKAEKRRTGIESLTFLNQTSLATVDSALLRLEKSSKQRCVAPKAWGFRASRTIASTRCRQTVVSRSMLIGYAAFAVHHLERSMSELVPKLASGALSLRYGTGVS